MAICISSRASGAPMQKWMPAPKATCGLGSRSGHEAVWLREARRVAVGGTQHQPDAFALLQADPSIFKVFQRIAGEKVERRIVAQRLLHAGLVDAVTDALFQQALDAVAQRMDGRLVAGVEQQDGGGDEFVLRQLRSPVPRP